MTEQTPGPERARLVASTKVWIQSLIAEVGELERQRNSLLDALRGLFTADIDVWRHNHDSDSCDKCAAIDTARAAITKAEKG